MLPRPALINTDTPKQIWANAQCRHDKTASMKFIALLNSIAQSHFRLETIITNGIVQDFGTAETKSYS